MASNRYLKINGNTTFFKALNEPKGNKGVSEISYAPIFYYSVSRPKITYFFL